MVRQRFDEIVRDQNNISNSLFKKYYKYPSPSIMHKVLNETRGIQRNEIQAELIKNGLDDIKKDIDIENTPKKNMHKIEKKKKTMDIVEKNFYFNDDENQDQQG